MTTIESLERLADAVEALAEDHKARVLRIEARRQQLALHLDELTKLFTGVHALIKLEDAELAETNGEREAKVPRRFKTIAGGKLSGDGSRKGGASA